ncbi:MAG: P-type conjugative transfer protein TrbG [Vitreimonas sp.]
MKRFCSATMYSTLALLAACATPPVNEAASTHASSLDATAPTELHPSLPFAGAVSEAAPPPVEVATPARPRQRAIAPLSALTAANAEARRHPDPNAFVDATQMYDYAPGALYEVYAAPGYLSTVLLEPGEVLITVAAGDTTRWLVEETTSGYIANPRGLLLLKPTRAGIRTNVVLVTDRRTYLIEAIAVAGQNYSAQTAWRYPNDAVTRTASVIDVSLEAVNFRYRIETVRGRAPHWRPVRVFDDGRRTYVEFPLDIATSEAPPLFLRDGNEAALVNYRVVGNRYVVDRLFDVAELRLGGQRQTIVRITRERANAARVGWRR